MINQTIVGILKNESLMKNIFSGMGYFMFIGVIIKLVLSSIENGNYLGIALGLVMSFMLIVFAIFFISVHVIRPIIKITWADFGIPGIDEGVEKLPLKKLILRTDVLIFILLATLSLLAGLQLIQILLEAKS